VVTVEGVADVIGGAHFEHEVVQRRVGRVSTAQTTPHNRVIYRGLGVRDGRYEDLVGPASIGSLARLDEVQQLLGLHLKVPGGPADDRGTMARISFSALAPRSARPNGG
jgi:hypothetical protein